jgi:hypothetical protein
MFAAPGNSMSEDEKIETVAKCIYILLDIIAAGMGKNATTFAALKLAARVGEMTKYDKNPPTEKDLAQELEFIIADMGLMH